AATPRSGGGPAGRASRSVGPHATPACGSDCPTVRLACHRAAGSDRSMSNVVAITAIAAGGDGVGRLADGRAVFVARTAPGERVRLRDGGRLHNTRAPGPLAEAVPARADRGPAGCHQQP